MTTIILVNKLLSMKAGESDYEKIEHLKKRNMQEIAQTNRTLQKLLKKQRGIKKCRLCLKPAEKNIFHNETDSNMVDNIKSILNIEIEQNDGKPQDICFTCESIVLKAAELKQTAEIVQWRLQKEIEIESESVYNENVDDYNNFDDGKIYISEKITSTINEYKRDNKKTKVTIKHGPYICEICGLEVKSMSRLKTHRLIHTKDFKHSCAHCPFRTRNPYSLRIHERSHTGDRPYRCTQCPATFISTSNLASHRRSHLPPSYKCDTCHKGFKFKQPLLSHIATQHRNAKPFICCVCENSFATSKLLRRHERKIHNRPRMRVGATPSYIKSQEEIDTESNGYDNS